MKKIQILFVDHTPFAGGAQLCLASHIKYLNRDRFQPFLVIAKSSKFGQIYKESNVPIFRIDFEPLKRRELKAVGRLKNSVGQFNKIISSLQPDIVLANTTRALIVAALAKKNFKLISYVRDYDYPRWLVKIISPRVDRFLAVSGSIKDFYSGKDWQVVYLGSDLNHQLSQVKLKQVREFKKRLGIERGDRVIGYAGRLVGWKGPQVLVKALVKIENPKVKLMFFGSGKGQPGDIEGLISRLINKYHLENRVRLGGFVPERALIYKSLDIFVLSSKEPEPFATNVIEAAMAGLPIAATNTGGTAEFIKDGKNGLLITPGDSDELAYALLRLIGDRKLQGKLGNQAKLSAETFTEERLAKRMERIYIKI